MARLFRSVRIGPVAIALAGFFFISLLSQAQTPSADSLTGLTLNTDSVAPQRFIAAHGRRALIAGYASDSLEIWAYPFQILSGYRVAFRSTGSTTPINGQDILSRVTYQPDSITRIYLGPDFVAQEKLFVPLNEAGAILTYSIHCAHPVDIEVHATPVLNLMWPAGLGGQSSAWDAGLSAFVLSEPAHGISAVIGSPQIVAHDDIGNRTVQGAGGASLGLTLHPDKEGNARLFVELNSPHTSDIGAALHGFIDDQQRLEAESATHVADVQNKMLRIETPDSLVNRAIAWSEIALDQAWVCNPDLGCGFIAGYGPSRGARRPQYDWFFAGDGLIAADAAVAAGDIAHAREELAFILRYQDKKTGMIWHELSQSAGYLDWVGKFPYMFVHVDITFQFLGTLATYVKTTGDTAFLRDHWTEIQAAYRYCSSVIDPATGLPRIPADKEGGDEQDRMSDDLDLSTSWVAASSGFAQMSQLTGHAELATEAEAASRRARSAIPSRYWSSQQEYWISGHSQSGVAMLEKRSGPSEALDMHLFPPGQESHLLNQLASSAFQTDWGTRGIGEGSAGFDPESYSKGSVSAVGTAVMASTLWAAHRPVSALAIWQTLLPWTSLDSEGHMHEVLAGNFYRAQVESVPEQTWSSAAFIKNTIHGLFGLDVDSQNRHFTFAPHLPATWSNTSITQLHVSDSILSLSLHRTSNKLTLEMENSGDPVHCDFSPELPLGATLERAELNNQGIPSKIEAYPQETDALVSFNLPHGKSQLELTLHGGVSIIVDNSPPLVGATSIGLRIVETRLKDHTLTVIVDVPTSRDSDLRLNTLWAVKRVDGATVQQPGAGIKNLRFSAVPGNSSAYRRATATIDFIQ